MSPHGHSHAHGSGHGAHAVFGARARREEQTRILSDALAALVPPHATAVFDLDSTLLDNGPRQARIVREFGAEKGDERLAACTESAFPTWDLRDTLRIVGFSREGAEAVYPSLKEFWRARFFTSEYCKDDAPIAGAAQYLARVMAAGAQIVFITGRHAGMGAGTLESFKRAGFPLPDGARVDLWLKPGEDEDDDAWKERCHARLLAQGHIGAAFDNEPTHVNAYKRSFPQARVVHLDTDHSGRPVEVLESIPSVADFRMEAE